MRLAIATRSAGKLAEIRRILAGIRIDLLTLDDLQLPPRPDEDAIETHATFAANARAKALHFAERTGLPTLADDSGIVVDALGGRPGVRSRRFAADHGAAPADADPKSIDDANNRLLLDRLRGRPDHERGARFVCAACLALAPTGPTFTAIGTLAGRIGTEPRGNRGFGYDPLFFLPEARCTTAEMPPAEKNRISHRAIAFRALGGILAATVHARYG